MNRKDDIIATLIVNTYRQKRIADLVEIGLLMKEFIEVHGTISELAEILRISTGMIRKFLAIERVIPEIYPLIKNREIDSVEMINSLSKLTEADQRIIAKELAGSQFTSQDLRVLVPLRLKQKTAEIHVLIDQVKRAKPEKVYVIHIEVKENFNAAELTNQLQSILAAENIKETYVSEEQYTVKFTADGLSALKKAAQKSKMSLEEFVHDLSSKAYAKGHKQVLDRQKYYGIQAGLSEFRIDKYIRSIEKRQGANKGTILPFVRGLRFAALLIYSIRKTLRNDLDASWGHLINDDGELSRECDIIIHKKGQFVKWNGDGEDKIMDFRFIEIEKALAVISCKSFMNPASIEKDYCGDLDAFTKNVWLFVECCGPDSVQDLANAATTHGYKKFWHLYTWNRSNDDVKDAIDAWDDFIETLRAL